MFNYCYLAQVRRPLALLALAAMFMPSFGIAQTYPADDAKLFESAKKEGTVVWYESGPIEPMLEVAADFQKLYPGVKVEVLRIVGVQQYQRFMQEVQAKRHMADILHISDQPSMAALVADGHVADWKVPAHDRYAPAFRLQNHAYANALQTSAIIYNVNKVTAEEIRILEASWKGVLDPRFKGRFAVTAAKTGASYAGVHLFMDPKLRKEYGPEFLKKVAAQKPAIYAGTLQALDRVVAGEQAFTYWSWEAVGYTQWLQGAPVRWLFPAPTPEWGNSWQAVSKYAPHPNAARLFQNWSMSEAGAISLQEKYGVATTIRGVADRRKVAKESWYKPVKQRYDVDFKRWDNDYHKDMDLWDKALQEARQ